MKQDTDSQWLEAKIQRLEGRMQNIELNIRYYRSILARLGNNPQKKRVVKLEQLTMFGT